MKKKKSNDHERVACCVCTMSDELMKKEDGTASKVANFHIKGINEWKRDEIIKVFAFGMELLLTNK